MVLKVYDRQTSHTMAVMNARSYINFFLMELYGPPRYLKSELPVQKLDLPPPTPLKSWNSLSLSRPTHTHIFIFFQTDFKIDYKKVSEGSTHIRRAIIH